jgi:hypothetical protein
MKYDHHLASCTPTPLTHYPAKSNTGTCQIIVVMSEIFSEANKALLTYILEASSWIEHDNKSDYSFL